MTIPTTPHVDIPLLHTAQGSPRTRHNLAMLHADLHAAPAIKEFRTAPPGSPADLDAYYVDGTGSGAWAGKNKTIQLAKDGIWYTSQPYRGMRIFALHEESTAPAPEFVYWFDDTEEWVPMFPRWCDQDSDVAAEHFTGQTFHTKKRYAKSLKLDTLPNNTTKTFAHGISSLQVGQVHGPCWDIWISDGSSVLSENFTSVATLQHTLVVVDATNVAITTNYNASGSDGFIRLEYCKTT